MNYCARCGANHQGFAKRVVKFLFYVLLLPVFALPATAYGTAWLWHWAHDTLPKFHEDELRYD